MQRNIEKLAEYIIIKIQKPGKGTGVERHRSGINADEIGNWSLSSSSSF